MREAGSYCGLIADFRVLCFPFHARVYTVIVNISNSSQLPSCSSRAVSHVALLCKFWIISWIILYIAICRSCVNTYLQESRSLNRVAVVQVPLPA